MTTHPRHRCEVLGNSLRITIPSLKKWPTLILFVGELAVWSVAGPAIAWVLVSGRLDDRALGAFLMLWLTMWAISEIISVYAVLWQFFGQEEIEVAPDSIAIRQAILGIGWPKVFSSEHISRMRTDAASSVEPYASGSDGVSLSKGTGVIAFAYKKGTIRMGIGIDLAEAEEIIAEIQRQYPQYKN